MTSEETTRPTRMCGLQTRASARGFPSPRKRPGRRPRSISAEFRSTVCSIAAFIETASPGRFDGAAAHNGKEWASKKYDLGASVAIGQITSQSLGFRLLLSADSETFSDQNQVRQRSHAHFFHDVAAMDLHRRFAYADLGCDLLIHQPTSDQRHDLALAGS